MKFRTSSAFLTRDALSLRASSELADTIDIRLTQCLRIERQRVRYRKHDDRKQSDSINHDCSASRKSKPQSALHSFVCRQSQRKAEARCQHHKDKCKRELELA